MVFCEYCGNEFDSGNFCPECGAKGTDKTLLICPKCNFQQSKRDWKFCSKCGYKNSKYYLGTDNELAQNEHLICKHQFDFDSSFHDGIKNIIPICSCCGYDKNPLDWRFCTCCGHEKSTNDNIQSQPPKKQETNISGNPHYPFNKSASSLNRFTEREENYYQAIIDLFKTSHNFPIDESVYATILIKYELTEEESTTIRTDALNFLLSTNSIGLEKLNITDLICISRHGNISATIRLFNIYFQGEGTPQDTEKAFIYAKMAFERGMENFRCFLIEYYMDRSKKNFNCDLAFNLSEEKANNSNPKYFVYLGHFYFFGIGCIQNYSKARLFFEAALNLGFESCLLYEDLARIYYYGNGLSKNLHKAMLYAKQATKYTTCSSDIYNILGLIYYEGQDEEVNYPLALEYFFRSAKKNNYESLRYIGDIYSFGDEGVKNLDLSFQYYKESADFGNGYSCLRCGQFYFYGHAQQKNFYKAKEYFSKAALKKYFTAEIMLAFIAYAIDNNSNETIQYIDKLKDNFHDIQYISDYIISSFASNLEVNNKVYSSINFPFDIHLQDCYKRALKENEIPFLYYNNLLVITPTSIYYEKFRIPFKKICTVTYAENCFGFNITINEIHLPPLDNIAGHALVLLFRFLGFIWSLERYRDV